MKKETVLCAMLATATCATAQNGKIQTSGVCADSNHGKTKRATLQKRNVIFVPKNEM